MRITTLQNLFIYFRLIFGVLLAVLAVFSLSACGGGETFATSEPVATPTQTATIAVSSQLIRPASSDATAPLMVFSGTSGSGITAIKTPNGSQVEVKVGGVTYRSQFDAAGQLLETVNTTSGEKLKVEYVAGRVHLLQYDAIGALLGATAVFVQAGVVKVADIVGLPAMEGQIAGNTSGANPSGFSLVADDLAGLSNIRTVDARMLNLVNSLHPTAAKNANSFEEKQAVGGIDLVSVTRYALVGVLVGAVAAPASAVAVGAVTVGAAFGMIGQVISSNRTRLDAISTCMDNSDTCPSSSFDIGNSAGMTLFGGLASNQSANEIIDDAVNGRQTKWDILKNNVKRAFDRASDSIPVVSDSSDFSTAAPLPVVSTGVTGLLVDSQNRTANLSGTVDSSGRINVTGVVTGSNTSTISLALTTSGTLPKFGQTATASTTVQGSLTGALGSGTAEAKFEAFGACNAVQLAGQQGTSSSAHRLGNGNGSSLFSYDAFSIPDAFTVAYGNSQRFTTGGLVSGSGSAALVLDGNPIVFVTVSAPRSGTAWKYSLSCP